MSDHWDTGVTATEMIDEPLQEPVGFNTAITKEPEMEDTPAYPDNNPKTTFGIVKPSMSAVPPVAMLHLMKAFSDGVKKYGRMNWRDKTVSSTIYYDAAMRHMMSWYDGEQLAEDSKVHHLGHAMACMAIILDAEANGMLNDDRPLPGRFAELVSQMTAKL